MMCSISGENEYWEKIKTAIMVRSNVIVGEKLKGDHYGLIT